METSDFARIDRLMERITVDPNNLERECSEQASLFEEIGDLSSLAKTELSSAELTRDMVKARVELDIRKSPGNYELTKITEGSVKAALALSIDVQNAEQDVVAATRTYSRVRSLMAAFDQRRSMISSLVSLYVHNYYVSGEYEAEDTRKKLTEDKRAELQQRIVNKRSENREE